MRASRGEIKIQEILEMNEMTFKMEYIFPDLKSSNGRSLRFDFAVFDDDGKVDFLIEFQGSQHYKPSSKFGGQKGLFQQKYNDNLKRRFCAQMGYTLIEIPFYDEDEMDFDYIMLKAGY